MKAEIAIYFGKWHSGNDLKAMGSVEHNEKSIFGNVAIGIH